MKSSFRKYRYIFKAALMESLQYSLNIILGFFMFFIILFVFMNLWKHIYSDPSKLINGYSMDQMIWYVVLTEIVWFGTRNNTLTTRISSDIKSGSIAYVINKPYHYIFYMTAGYLGETSVKFFLYLAAGLLIGYGFIGNFPEFSLLYLPLVLIVFVIGMMINTFLQMSISVLSFWIEDAAPFHWIYSKIILILGILFPVEMFPEWAQPVIRFLPVYVVTYGPVKLVIDFSFRVLIEILAAQGIYLVLSYSLLMGLYRKGVKRVNVNGG